MASEIIQVFENISNKHHFILSGGAGSGKTHTLIDILQTIYKDSPLVNIACITYTNVASDEIRERANFDNLHVSTIHDFLWMNIKNFQISLKKALLVLHPDINIDDIESIEYREYKNYKKGIISHDDVILISEYLYKKHPLLSKILKDKYDFIFIDEYQDTLKPVIEIFFNHINQTPSGITIGLFGDSMQSIYESGVGDVNFYTCRDDDTIPKIIEVPKLINRRNPQLVIDLANELRLDGLEQFAEENNGAPNNHLDGTIKQGEIKFLYSKSKTKFINDIKQLSVFKDWDFNNTIETKELYLSHALISDTAGFGNLMDIYYRDKLVGGNGYVKRVKDFIKAEGFIVGNNMTFSEVIDVLLKRINLTLSYEGAMEELKSVMDSDPKLTYIKAANILNKKYPQIKEVLPTDTFYKFISSNKDSFSIAMKMPFEELSKIYLDKDKLIGKKKSSNEDSNKRNDERDYLIKQLIKIQDILYMYEKKQYFKMLKVVDLKIHTVEHKGELKKRLEKLYSLKNNSIKDVLEKADNLKICIIDLKTKEFLNSNKYLINRVLPVNFGEITKLYDYTEGNSIYSTQHGIKGAEFKNVLVSLDESGDKKLNYKYLFEQDDAKPDILKRTQKLFYVCCTRAKDNLVVFYNEVYSQKAIEQANEWFGETNVINVDDLILTE